MITKKKNVELVIINIKTDQFNSDGICPQGGKLEFNLRC